MARVICTLPNASGLINGIRFASVPDGMMSEDVNPTVAAQFASIAGYALVPEAPPPEPPALKGKKE